MPVAELSDGRALAWSEGGDPRGRPVLFFHGCPDTRRASWSGYDAAERLGVRLVAANRPGYGASTPAAPSYRRVVDDATCLADLLGIERFGVVGMSVGGTYALACAALAPTRVRRVALVACPGESPRMTPPWPRDDPDERQQRWYAALADGTPEQNLSVVGPGFLDYRASVGPDDPDDEALAARWLATLPREDRALVGADPAAEVAAAAREAIGVPDGYLADAALVFARWEFAVEEVRCPVTLWYGERDATTPLRNGRWLAERLPDATLHPRPGLGHLESLLRSWPEVLGSVS